MPGKEQREMVRHRLWFYRPCPAPDLPVGRLIRKIPPPLTDAEMAASRTRPADLPPESYTWALLAEIEPQPVAASVILEARFRA
jgi:hypothetical protein